MDDMSNQAAPADTEDTGTDMSGGYVIEIRCTPDGKFAVGVEPLAEESQEEGAGAAGEGEDGESADHQSVGSLGEALKLVREIVAHAGEMTDTTASADEMSAGYKSGT